MQARLAVFILIHNLLQFIKHVEKARINTIEERNQQEEEKTVENQNEMGKKQINTKWPILQINEILRDMRWMVCIVILQNLEF